MLILANGEYYLIALETYQCALMNHSAIIIIHGVAVGVNR